MSGAAVYAPRDGRVRDEDNLTATAKPLYDGIVDAAVVPDDGPAFMLTPTERFETDLAFHEALCRLGGNQILLSLWSSMKDLMRMTVCRHLARRAIGAAHVPR